MLESFVSVLPSDWFSLSGWPRFQETHCKLKRLDYSLSISLRLSRDRNLEFIRLFRKRGLWSAECGVRSAECVVRSLKKIEKIKKRSFKK